MIITNITRENFLGVSTYCEGPKLEITLEGRPNEFNKHELLGRDVTLVATEDLCAHRHIRNTENRDDWFMSTYYGQWASSLADKKESLSPDKLFVKNVYYNKEKGVTVVIFEDGVKITKKLSEGDIFDLRTAVALAITERIYGSRTKFAKTVDKIAVDQVAKSKKTAKKTEEK